MAVINAVKTMTKKLGSVAIIDKQHKVKVGIVTERDQ